MTIPKNTPAIRKYLPFFNVDEVSDSYREACIQHGMMYGKLREEAERTERLCDGLAVSLLGNMDCHKELFELRTAYAESAKSRHLWEKYLVGNGVEIGSGGWPMVPHAIQCELSKPTYAHYNSGNEPEFPIQWHSDSMDLPFKDNTMDWVSSSHLIEDFVDWTPLIKEWTRILKPGGYLVILLPDKKLWAEAMERGQPPNCAHKHESYVGELSEFTRRFGITPIEERLTSCYPGDYTIMFVGRKNQ